MKHSVLFSIVFALTLTSAAMAEEPPHQFTVSGTYELRVAPDRAVWNINCSDSHKSITKAKAMNDEKIDNLMALAKELEVAPEDLQSSTLDIRKETEYDKKAEKNVFKGYQVSRSVRIVEHDFSKLDLFLDALIDAGEFEASLSFENSKMEELRWDIRLKALEIAKKKAEAMVEVLGVELGDVITFSENSANHYAVSNSISNISTIFGSESGDSTSGTFAPGSLSIKISVQVTYEIQ